MTQMNWRRYVRSQLPPLNVSAERESEIVEELAIQFESRYERERATGCDHAEALRRAADEVEDWEALGRSLAGIERAGPPVIEGAGPWSGLAVDARQALRSVTSWKASTAAIGMLALSVAASLTVINVVGSWMAPLPFTDPDRVAIVWGTNHAAGQARDVVSGPTFTDLQRRSSSFEHLAAFAQGSLSVRRDGDAGSLATLLVTPDFFQAAGVSARAGRVFDAGDIGANRVVISHEFWQSQLGGDPGVIGRTLRELGLPHEVIGVLPSGFRVLSHPDVVLLLDPKAIEREARTYYYYWVIARLRDGVSLGSAQADLDTVMRLLAARHPAVNGWTATIEGLAAAVAEPVRPSLLVLMVIGGLVLIVGIGNTFNLVASHALNRRREMAVRAALGASAARVQRQWLFEGLLLSTAATGAAIILALAALAVIAEIAPASAAIAGSAATVELPALRFTAAGQWSAVAIALVLAAILGAAPRRSVRFGDIRGAFSTAPVTLTSGRRWLLSAQAAIATLLTLVAGLLLVLVLRLAATSPGFDPQRLTAFLVGGLHDLDAGARARYYQQLLEAVRRQPGVSEAALNDYVPLTNEDDFEGIEIPGRRRDGMPAPREEWRRVSGRYFETLDIPLIRGRYLTPADDERSLSVVVVNAAMARKYWPDQDPIGSRIRITNRAYGWSEIVGVVGDVREAGLDRAAKPMMFVPLQRDPRPEMGLFVRATGGSATTIAAIEQVVRSVDPSRPIREARTMEQIVRGSYSVQRAVLAVAAGLAILTLVLIAGGTYAVVSLVTRARDREMAIRVSLGARPADVAAAVLTAPWMAAAAGIAAGLGIAFPAIAFVQSRVMGLPGLDLPIGALTVSIVSATVALACAAPALRAMAAEPAVTLKGE